jgi:hypothetical protein
VRALSMVAFQKLFDRAVDRRFLGEKNARFQNMKKVKEASI